MWELQGLGHAGTSPLDLGRAAWPPRFVVMLWHEAHLNPLNSSSCSLWSSTLGCLIHLRPHRDERDTKITDATGLQCRVLFIFSSLRYIF